MKKFIHQTRETGYPFSGKGGIMKEAGEPASERLFLGELIVFDVERPVGYADDRSVRIAAFGGVK